MIYSRLFPGKVARRSFNAADAACAFFFFFFFPTTYVYMIHDIRHDKHQGATVQLGRLPAQAGLRDAWGEAGQVLRHAPGAWDGRRRQVIVFA